MAKNNHAKGYYTEQGQFYEYDDARNLTVGEYVDIVSQSTSGYWVDDNGYLSNITASTYEALVEDGANESENEKKTFENEYNGQPVYFEYAQEIAVYQYIDIDGGRVIGYKAEYNGEFDISSSTYDALVVFGAREGNDIWAFLDDYNNQLVPLDNPRTVILVLLSQMRMSTKQKSL